MKLFTATLAMASAQDFAASEAGDDARTFSFGDSAFDYGASAYAGFGDSAFYDSAYGSDYNSLAAAYNYDDADAAAADADASVADEAGRDKDEARYFGVAVATTTATTTTTFTTTPVGSRYCLKCDVMSTSKCAAKDVDGATEEACQPDDVCFLEIRRSQARPAQNKVTQICTGCKNAQACWDLKQQNAIQHFTKFRKLSQCHEENASNSSPRLGEIASVCRTCFKPSDTAWDSTTTKNEKFLIGNANDLSLTIPKGDGVSETVVLYGSDKDTFNRIWFTSRHGLSIGTSYDLDFSLATLA